MATIEIPQWCPNCRQPSKRVASMKEAQDHVNGLVSQSLAEQAIDIGDQYTVQRATEQIVALCADQRTDRTQDAELLTAVYKAGYSAGIAELTAAYVELGINVQLTTSL